MNDPLVYGADSTPGIVAVHADLSGRALIWRRENQQVRLERARFRSWLYARDLADVEHLGARLAGDDDQAPFSVRELSGSPGSLRYLLSAHDGRTLRQAVLTGAQRRLGRRVTSLHDLSGYYSVGAVEQYLMTSGRTYFKGLAFDDVHRLQFDLETTSLTPETGRIFMAAIRDNQGFEQVLEAPQPEDESALIRMLMQVITSRNPDVIENHNVMRFDLPYLLGRAKAHGLAPNFSRPGGPAGLWQVQDGRSSPHWACAGREIVDTLDAVRRLDLPSMGLKAVSQHLGLAPADRVYLEGALIAQTYQTDPERVRRYALQDVEEVDALARQVLAPSFALAQMAPRPYHRLPYAGTATGMLEPMLVRAYLQAGHALPGSPERTTTPHKGGAVELYAEGVLTHVVKADVASMYPSIIRHDRIGSAADPLGVFLHLMDHLTALRLHHKAAAKRGEHGEHDAIQGAMKLVVNSGYGYLGAGRLALFGDQQAADRITARGRELLGTVVRALQARGVTLIEADTDGVFFATPEAWTEEQERHLIAEVDASLPDGIALEFDGRAQAMLSHEIKNYVLLRYDGRLELRGAAFESSRTESYGRAFLHQALRCLLSGDVPGVRQAYLKALNNLEARACTNADVASRVRLTKSPEAYAGTRPTRKEAAYEALTVLKRSWQPGERVTLYHRAGHGLTPLDVNPEGRDYDVSHYAGALIGGYASRLRKGLNPEDFRQIFNHAGQPGLFDRPFDEMKPQWSAL
ncbi:3'-5' exonuclease [Deinococcus multiflagellatus]|uniref:DNA-directed DNA polymerase n=1 Tax=Deinococcus multiflagellatus TaxID=1656887 RepID=A0ABW1ZPY5_9DEIO|nr:3'-5' exonuclease [Deinococcus multiflagellatus]MBZ9714900.1 ribonuclease H-like domain-containing protein [Deinococcus multiflagellatus]